MGFSEAVSAALGKYATFQGRARRSEYWWFVLFVAGTNLIGSALDMLFGWAEVGVFGILFSLALLLPGLTVLVRRLHDTGRTGWWALLPFALAPLGLAAGSAFGEAGIAAAGFVAVAIWIVAIVVLARPGTPGPNRFGDNPKASPQPWGTAARSSGS